MYEEFVPLHGSGHVNGVPVSQQQLDNIKHRFDKLNVTQVPLNYSTT